MRNGILFAIIGFLLGVSGGIFALYLGLPSSLGDADEVITIIDPGIIYRTIEINYAFLIAESIIGFGLLGAILGFVLALVKTLREREIKLYEALEVNRTKDEFISMVLHHLRTPLSGMRWALKDALDNLGVTDVQRKTVQMLYDENVRVLDAVEHLVQASQASIGRIEYHFEVMPLSALIEVIKRHIDTLRPLIQKKGLSLQMNIASNPKDSVKVDKKKIVIVVQTLLENAVIFTPRGGAIKITAEEKRGDFLLHIKDTGIGIPKEEQPRIFLQFFRGKKARRIDAGGFGIGLYIVKAFIEGHRGNIWFVSEEDKGATFTFRLPILKAAAEKFLEKI